MPTQSLRLRKLALAAGATGLLYSMSPAFAQPDDGYYRSAYNRDVPNEEVVIAVPRHHAQRSAIGAPIVDVALSQRVSFQDLDLRTDWGARELRKRIRFAASSMCRQLDVDYPVTADDSPPCYRTALGDAMYQADIAINNARGYAGTE
jgi:UrcA family protein